MRYLRSLAMAALAICASMVMTMPASAFTPIDPGLHAVAAPGVERPAPMVDNALHAVVIREASPTGLSTGADSASIIASTAHSLTAKPAGAATPLFEHRMRC